MSHPTQRINADVRPHVRVVGGGCQFQSYDQQNRSSRSIASIHPSISDGPSFVGKFEKQYMTKQLQEVHRCHWRGIVSYVNHAHLEIRTYT